MKPKTRKMQRSLLFSLGLWTVLLAQPARSHGAHIDYRIAPSVEVQAQFDNGEPMAQAQVAVFAPDNPENPWQTGLTDDAGAFRFSPDRQAGAWEVQVRQAGHGSVITIPVDAQGLVDAPGNLTRSQGIAGTVAGGGASLDPAQKLLMTGLGLWGLLGTGLFFARSPRSQPAAAQGNARTDATAEQSALTDVDASREPPIPV